MYDEKGISQSDWAAQQKFIGLRLPSLVSARIAKLSWVRIMMGFLGGVFVCLVILT